MAIIDITYFTGNRYIDLTNPDVQTNLESIFDNVEKKYLIKLLGRECYNDFDADTEPFKTLVDGGVLFNWNGYDREYYGLKNMLANFTYCEYINKNQSFNTSVGNVKFGTEKEPIGIDTILFDANYNDAVEDYWEAYKYMVIKNIGFEKFYTSRSIDYINSSGRLVI